MSGLLLLAGALAACSGGDNPTIVGDTGNNQNPPLTGGYTAELLMTGARVEAISGTAGGKAFAVSSDGMLMRRTPSGWVADIVPPTDARPSFVEDIFAVSDDAVFAVGNDVVFRFDGTKWHLGDPGSDDIPNGTAIWGDAPDNVFVAGFQGSLRHWDGVSWEPMESGTGEWLEGIWGGVLGSVFACGRNGTLLRFDGTQWNAIDAGVTVHLRHVWGLGNTLYIAGDNNTMLRHNGSTFETIASPGGVSSLWGTSANTPYAAAGGDVLRFNGTSWESLGFPASEHASAIWGTSGANIYVVTVQEDIYRFDGTSWSPEFETQQFGGWLSVFGFGDDNVFAGGQTRIARFDGSGVSVTDVTGIRNGSLFAMWGTSETDVWAVGHLGTALHFDGSFWSARNEPSEPFFRCITGTASNDVFAAGGDGAIFHWDGASWNEMNSGTTVAISDIAALSPDNVWAVGATGTILNYNGTSWVDHTSPTALSLRSVLALASDDVWALASDGQLIRFDGASWSLVAVPPLSGSRLRGDRVDNLFIADNPGSVQRFDGTDWSRLDSFSYQPMQDMYVTPGGTQVWTVTLGEGNVVKYKAAR